MMPARSRNDAPEEMTMECKRLLLIALTFAATAQPARADSIFVPGAPAVEVVFDATIAEIFGDIPLEVGTHITGTLTYDANPPVPFIFPLLDFTATIGGMEFTKQDVVSATIREFPGTFGFDAQVQLMGRPGLGDLSAGFLLELFREFGDSNLWLFSDEPEPQSRVRGDLTTLDFDTAQVPEPASLTLLAPALALLCRSIDTTLIPD
jgi:hypothetical protein